MCQWFWIKIKQGTNSTNLWSLSTRMLRNTFQRREPTMWCAHLDATWLTWTLRWTTSSLTNSLRCGMSLAIMMRSKLFTQPQLSTLLPWRKSIRSGKKKRDLKFQLNTMDGQSERMTVSHTVNQTTSSSTVSILLDHKSRKVSEKLPERCTLLLDSPPNKFWETTLPQRILKLLLNSNSRLLTTSEPFSITLSWEQWPRELLRTSTRRPKTPQSKLTCTTLSFWSRSWTTLTTWTCLSSTPL